MRGERESVRRGAKYRVVVLFFLTDYTEVIVLHMSRNLDVALDFVEGVSLFFVKYIEVVVSDKNHSRLRNGL
jgi:hypothetical protein